MAVFLFFLFMFFFWLKKNENYIDHRRRRFFPECTYSKYSLGGSHPIIRFGYDDGSQFEYRFFFQTNVHYPHIFIIMAKKI